MNGRLFYNSESHFYKGDFKNGVPEGNGCFYYPSGSYYEGDVKNG